MIVNALFHSIKFIHSLSSYFILNIDIRLHGIILLVTCYFHYNSRVNTKSNSGTYEGLSRCMCGY